MAGKLDRIALDQEFVKIVDNAVQETFGSFFGIKPELKNALTGKFEAPRVDLSGIIAFIQNDIEGTLAIRFRSEDLFKIIAPLYEEKIESIDSRSLGSVGEFANIIHGVIKQELNANGFNYQMCLPVVVVGENHIITSTFKGNRLLLKYDLDGSEAILDVTFKE